MLITNKKSFIKGTLYMLSFVAVFLLILSPVFHGPNNTKITGLDYADNLFNRLSKGSSWFIPEIKPRVSALEGKEIDLTINLKNAASTESVLTLLAASGASASAGDGGIHIKGDLGKLLGAALFDSEHIYNDNPKPVSERYGGMDGYEALAYWWQALQPMIKELQKARLIPEAQVVDTVIRKGIEPAYNFKGIVAGDVKKEFLIMLGLLIFYVIYTLWYGFAIFDLFEGIGLTMKKGKKQEA